MSVNISIVVIRVNMSISIVFVINKRVVSCVKSIVINVTVITVIMSHYQMMIIISNEMININLRGLLTLFSLFDVVPEGVLDFYLLQEWIITIDSVTVIVIVVQIVIIEIQIEISVIRVAETH